MYCLKANPSCSDAFGNRRNLTPTVRSESYPQPTCSAVPRLTATYLRATDLLGSASAADLEAIAAASRPRTFRRGQILFSTGDPGDTVIVVISGRVKVVVRSADGGELTVLGPGGVLGELGAIDGGPRSARRRDLG
ncbi:MAG: cyclic nucleotide-binding domain-containing protein [Streptosporangiaceae bacterium]